MKTMDRIAAVILTALLLISVIPVSAGAITVVNGGKEYTFRSHTPTVGDINVLMIRLGFADYPADDPYDPADSADTLLSYFDGSENSVSGFYETSSYGKLHLHCDKVYTYNAQYERQRYDHTDELSVSDLLFETLTALKGEIDFDDYDSDGDGYLDFVCFDYAGPMGNWGETWWPHVSSDADITIEGKRLSTYTLLRGNERTMKHEFGHILGADDYYSYAEGRPLPLMTFDLMSSNECDHCGFNKWLFGWLCEEDITFVDRASGDTTVALKPIESPLGDGKKIAVVAPSFNADTPFLDEYFLVEYDAGTGNNKELFEYCGYTPGFRIFHVNAAAKYQDEDASADFVMNNYHYRLNLIHNVKNELSDPQVLRDEEMFYREGDALTPMGYPNTGFATETLYNGVYTGISFTDFVTGDNPSFRVSFSDEEPDPVAPELTLTCDSLNAQISMTLRSDAPLEPKKASAEDYEAPYLIDANGVKLTLDVSSKYGSAERFEIRYLNASPVVLPDTEYTLVIPEGFFMTGYNETVPEYRQTIRTDVFMPLTQIERYSDRTGFRFSNIFTVTDNTYGRIILNADTSKCDFVEYNLNGEEIARSSFTAPEYHASPKFLFGCRVTRLFDGSFALGVYTFDNTYFTRIDRFGAFLSETVTVSDALVAGYADNLESIELEPFKDGLGKILTAQDYSSSILLTIDFERGAAVAETELNDSYIPLDGDHYLVRRFYDGGTHLRLFDKSDSELADIVVGDIFLGAYLQGESLHVLSKTIDFNRVATVYHASYDLGGKPLSEEDITPRAGYLADAFHFDRVIASDSGFYLITTDSFDRTTTVVACDGTWKKLGEFTFQPGARLAFAGECGLCEAYRYFEEEADAAYVVSRFNIGAYEIVPVREVYLLGDVDGDGEVTILDATYIQRKLAQLDLPFMFIDRTADADGDADISILDATELRRWLAKLPSNGRIGTFIL